MKFICEGIVLSDAATTVSKACSTKSLNPALESIKMTAQNDVVTLIANDGEISIEKKIKAEVIEEGETLVNGRFFADFIAKISDKMVSVFVSEKGMEIKYDDSKSMMAVLPAKDFPHVRKDEMSESIQIKECDFKNLIAKTVFCSATDDSRPILKGCLLETKGDELHVSALDGFRMAVVQSDLKECTGKISVVCPARTLNEIARMLDGDEGDVTVYTQNGMMMVRIDSTLVLSRLYHGEFINYRNITPADFTTVVEVGKEELIESVERASVLIRGDKNDFILLELKNDGIRISSNSEMGNVSEKVPCAFEGKELKIAMKAKYVLEATKAIEADRIVISFNTSISPFILRAKEENGTFYLVLPVRTNF